jgi:hypothetical protein
MAESRGPTAAPTPGDFVEDDEPKSMHLVVSNGGGFRAMHTPRSSSAIAVTVISCGMALAMGGCVGPDDERETVNQTGILTLDGTDGNTATATETDGADETAGGEAQLRFLEVTPAEAILEVDLGMTASQAYTVTAVYTDGSTIDVTADATWEVSNPVVGAMNGATLEVPAFADSTFTSAILTADVNGEEGQAQVTIAAYRLDSDFFFVLPFEDDGGPQEKPLTFSTDVKSMDVFVSMDTTGSMGGAIANLQNAMASTIIPGIQALVPDTQFGAGTFEDFPLQGYGDPGPDQPFELFQEITADVAAVQNAVLSFALGSGADIPESNIEALYQIATGEGLVGPAPTNVPPNASGIGGVGFREGALPVVVSITDAISHDPAHNECGQGYAGAVQAVAHSREQAMDALDGICARVVQIALFPGACSALEDGIRFAEATGAVIPPEAWDLAGHPGGCAAGQCCTGLNGAGVAPNASGQCPMAYQANFTGTGVDTSFSSAIQLLAAYGRFNVGSQVVGVATDVDGVALPAGFTTADFIEAVTPFDHGPVPLPGVPDPALTPTTFEDVIPDTDVIFTVRAFNDFVPQEDYPRLFTATIEVLADDCGELDSREVFILVPPDPLPPPVG